jgi:hypothetical protein
VVSAAPGHAVVEAVVFERRETFPAASNASTPRVCPVPQTSPATVYLVALVVATAVPSA